MRLRQRLSSWTKLATSCFQRKNINLILFGHLRQRWETWLQKRSPYDIETRFSHQNLYILPTRLGRLFLLVIAVLFVGAANFGNSLIYALAYWLLSLLILNFLFTYKNVSGLVLRVETLQHAFVDDAVGAVISLCSDGAKSSYSICLSRDDEPAEETRVLDVAAHQRPHVQLSWTAQHRGYQPMARITISSTFPLGLARVWGFAYLKAEPVAFPKPIQSVRMDFRHADQAHGDIDHDMHKGSTDFYALREFQPGDSYKHIHWPSFTKSDAPLVKTFVDYRGEETWLRWAQFEGLEVEARLCHLSYLLDVMETAQQPYGLDMPNGCLELGVGPAQRESGFMLLALYGQAEPDGNCI